MAADPAVGDIFLLTHKMSLLGQKLIGTHHFRINSLGGAFPDMDTFCSEVYTKVSAPNQLNAKLLLCIPTNCSLDSTWIQRIKPTRARRRTFGIGTFGSGFGTAESANVQGSITRQDDEANRRSTGALHVPIAPIPVTTMVSGSFTAGPLSALQNLAPLMVGTFVTASGFICQWVLYHKTFPPGTLNYTNITQAYQQTTVRVMRRRTVGVGK